MELNYGMSLEQKQQLSQNQIQSLEVLAMDSVELSEFLQDEYLENPLLDYSEEHAMPGGREDIGQTYEQPPGAGTELRRYCGGRRPEKKNDIPMPETENIKNYILEQLPDGACSRKLAEFMTDCLDDNGFFTIPAEEVRRKPECRRRRFPWDSEGAAGTGALWDFRAGPETQPVKTAGDAGTKKCSGQSGGEGTPAGCGRWKDQCHFQGAEALNCRSTQMHRSDRKTESETPGRVWGKTQRLCGSGYYFPER